ncbi:MAG: YesL family protein [Treponema sp.]|nr:YesL family protein [Treponema sp.]
MSKAPNPKIFKPMTLKKYLQFLLLGLLCLLLCIPVVTIGAATCSVYYVALKILNDEADVSVVKLFFKGIKENFVQGLLMFLISVATLGGTGAFIWWILTKSERGILLVCLAIGICFVVLVLNIFTYPIIGRYENTFSNKLRNTVALAFTYNRETLRCTGFVAAELAIAGVLFRLNLFAGCVSLLFWPSLIFYTIACFMAYIFDKVENPIQYDDNGDPIVAKDDNENKNQNEEIES